MAVAVVKRSLAEVRQLIGPAADGLSDKEVLALRDEAYAAAACLLDGCFRARVRALVHEEELPNGLDAR